MFLDDKTGANRFQLVHGPDSGPEIFGLVRSGLSEAAPEYGLDYSYGQSVDIKSPMNPDLNHFRFCYIPAYFL